MNAREYYAHIRALGPLPAHACLSLARLAAAADTAAAERKRAAHTSARPTMVFHEHQIGCDPIKLSHGVFCF